MQHSLKVVVTGATGHQGGAVARQLMENGHHVRAFTRHPDGRPARMLRMQGAEIFGGDLEQFDSIREALAGTDALFLVTAPFEGGIEAEIRQAMNACDAASDAEIRHLVYSSTACSECKTGVSFFESKYDVETYLRAAGVPFSIVAPVYFMENLLLPDSLEGLSSGQLYLPLSRSTPLQQVALSDLAAFVGHVFERREAFLGQKVAIASDEVAPDEMARTLSTVTGRRIEYQPMGLAELRRKNPDVFRMFDWLNRVGTGVKIENLRRLFPQIGWHQFEQWAAMQDWRVLEKAA